MNHPMGPLELADFIGLDVCVDVMEVLFEGFRDPKFRACPLLRKMVAAGWLGRKSGRGFYKLFAGKIARGRCRHSARRDIDAPTHGAGVSFGANLREGIVMRIATIEKMTQERFRNRDRCLLRGVVGRGRATARAVGAALQSGRAVAEDSAEQLAADEHDRAWSWTRTITFGCSTGRA